MRWLLGVLVLCCGCVDCLAAPNRPWLSGYPFSSLHQWLPVIFVPAQPRVRQCVCLFSSLILKHSLFLLLLVLHFLARLVLVVLSPTFLSLVFSLCSEFSRFFVPQTFSENSSPSYWNFRVFRSLLSVLSFFFSHLLVSFYFFGG